MPWLACHNPEIDWRTEEVQMTRCLKECGKKWRTVLWQPLVTKTDDYTASKSLKWI